MPRNDLGTFVWFALLAAGFGCSEESGKAGSGGQSGRGGSAGGSSGSSGSAGASGAAGSAGGTAFAACGAAIIGANGELNAAEYRRQARAWDRATIDCRLGPKFAVLNPGIDDPRPTAYEPEHKSAQGGYLCPSYELSGSCSGSCDYGSTAGQVLYAADDVMAAGVERIQNYAYEKGVICESIQSGGWLGGPCLLYTSPSPRDS